MYWSYGLSLAVSPQSTLLYPSIPSLRFFFLIFDFLFPGTFLSLFCISPSHRLLPALYVAVIVTCTVTLFYPWFILMHRIEFIFLSFSLSLSFFFSFLLSIESPYFSVFMKKFPRCLMYVILCYEEEHIYSFLISDSWLYVGNIKRRCALGWIMWSMINVIISLSKPYFLLGYDTKTLSDRPWEHINNNNTYFCYCCLLIIIPVYFYLSFVMIATLTPGRLASGLPRGSLVLRSLRSGTGTEIASAPRRAFRWSACRREQFLDADKDVSFPLALEFGIWVV